MTIDKAKLKALAEAATGFCDVEMAPDVVLALLAEIDHLTESRGVAREDRNRIGDRHDAIEIERDQLKAENEDYKSGQERYEQIIEDLKTENEALRKDAERFKWLIAQGADVAEQCTGYACDSICRQVIDELMSGGG